MADEDEIKRALKDLERLSAGSYLKRLVLLLGIGTFFDGFDIAIIGSVLPVLIVVMRLNYVQLGELAGSVYIGELFGAYIFGWVSEKYGRKWAYITAVLQYGLFTILTGLAWNYGSIYWFRLLSGFGLGGEVPVAAALVSEFAGTRRRGLIVLVYEILYAWGLFLAPLIAALVYTIMGEAIGWRFLFFLATIPLAAGIASIFALWESPRWLLNHGRIQEARAILDKLMKKTGAKKEDSFLVQLDKEIDATDTTPKKTRWLELFSKQYRRRTGFIWTAWFTAYFAIYGISIWLPTQLVRVGGLPVTMSLEVTALASGIGVAFGYLMTLTVDSVGRKTWSLIAYTISALGLIYGVIETLVFHNYHWQVLLITALPGFAGVGGVMGLLLYAYTAELYPTRMRGWATSVGSSLNRLASIIATYAVGVLMSVTATKYLEMGYVFTMFLVVVLVGLFVLAVFGIETKRRLLERLSP